MKITNEHVGRLLEARLERIHRAQKPGPRGEAGRPDQVMFSTRSEEVRAGMAAARAAGQESQARLTRLAAEVRAGRYRVPARVVAEAVLRDLGR